MARDPKQTPMMRQYLSLKEAHPDAVLFFRMGDFYEMFFEDAELAAKVLGLTLTTRDKGRPDPIPMAGVPYHAAEGYISRLVRQGHRVAVCEQVGDPATTKGIVDRSVVEIVTPGTAVSDTLVPETRNNFVAALHRDGETVGFAAADVTTGEFLLDDLPAARFTEDVSRLVISEWVTADDADLPGLPPEAPVPVRRPGWWFDPARGRTRLTKHFGVQSLRGFDCEDLGPAIGAAAALLSYLREVRGESLSHLVRMRRLAVASFLGLDATTRRNLELTRSMSGEERQPTVLTVLDRTRTTLGTRRLRSWLERPLIDRSAIEARLDMVQELTERTEEADALSAILGGVRDVERLLAKAAAGKASPRDLRGVAESCLAGPPLRERLEAFRGDAWARLAAALPDLTDLGEELDRAITEEPPATAGEGGVFRDGWHGELDELRGLARGGKEWIASLQRQEREATGIPTLKIGFNKVFGYYLEVTAAHQDKVPEHYIRKQTLVNAERFVTPELKTEEERILRAEERLRALELSLFAGLRTRVVERAADLQALADVIADADVALSLCRVAMDRGWVRPAIVDEPVLRFTEARHPVVEHLLPAGEFVPNDLDLDGRVRQIAIITGPNMAGKSTFLRQAGILTILAQMGSFVPAESARVGIVDRVFTRVGASDNISRGQSTFMVEMEETATILNAATERSLVLLDEVGRGTSTYDGLSIAWAVTENLHQRDEPPRTLFATHFHELTSLSETLARVVNLNVEVKEWNGSVIFLRKIVPGAADKSYGIHVAELAGIPPGVVDRAREILGRLETGRFARTASPRDTGPRSQLTLFEPVGNELLDDLLAVDPERLTPMDALRLIAAWKARHGDPS